MYDGCDFCFEHHFIAFLSEKREGETLQCVHTCKIQDDERNKLSFSALQNPVFV